MDSIEVIKHTRPALDDTTFSIQCLATGIGVASDLCPALHCCPGLFVGQVVCAAFLAEEFENVIWSIENIYKILELMLWTAEADSAKSAYPR